MISLRLSFACIFPQHQRTLLPVSLVPCSIPSNFLDAVCFQLLHVPSSSQPYRPSSIPYQHTTSPASRRPILTLTLSLHNTFSPPSYPTSSTTIYSHPALTPFKRTRLTKYPYVTAASHIPRHRGQSKISLTWTGRGRCAYVWHFGILDNDDSKAWDGGILLGGDKG